MYMYVYMYVYIYIHIHIHTNKWGYTEGGGGMVQKLQTAACFQGVGLSTLNWVHLALNSGCVSSNKLGRVSKYGLDLR